MVRFLFNFKGLIIAFLVICFVLFLGYYSAHQWYEGKSSPKDTISNFHNQIGSEQTTKKNEVKNTSNESSNYDKPEQSQNSQEPSSSENISTEDIARNLIKHAND